jgi:hypothetical protein
MPSFSIQALSVQNAVGDFASLLEKIGTSSLKAHDFVCVSYTVRKKTCPYVGRLLNLLLIFFRTFSFVSRRSCSFRLVPSREDGTLLSGALCGLYDRVSGAYKVQERLVHNDSFLCSCYAYDPFSFVCVCG